jgi:hypothetical protein
MKLGLPIIAIACLTLSLSSDMFGAASVKFSEFRRREGECNAGCVRELHESNGL